MSSDSSDSWANRVEKELNYMTYRQDMTALKALETCEERRLKINEIGLVITPVANDVFKFKGPQLKKRIEIELDRAKPQQKICIPWEMLSAFSALWSYIYYYLRPVIKWILRKSTKLCELQRICYGEEMGAKRTLAVEQSLQLSRQQTVKYIVNQLTSLSAKGKFVEDKSRNAVDYAVGIVCDVKDINTSFHRPFVIAFRLCLLQIYGYKQLIYEVESLRKTQYSSDNEMHEAQLCKLWSELMPDHPLESRISRQWGDIGFQGDDPKTDFRGMGLLGLENLLYFATEYNATARHVLSHSQHPIYGYSFAIVGINLTSMTYQLLIADKLKNHLFNTIKHKPHLKHFHQTYSYIFYEFDKFWLKEKPRDIMEFNRIRDKFEDHLIKYLSKSNAALKLNVAIETL